MSHRSPAKSSPARLLCFKHRVADSREKTSTSARGLSARSQSSGPASSEVVSERISLITPPSTPLGATPPTAVPKATLRELTPNSAGLTYDLYVLPHSRTTHAHTHTHTHTHNRADGIALSATSHSCLIFLAEALAQRTGLARTSSAPLSRPTFQCRNPPVLPHARAHIRVLGCPRPPVSTCFGTGRAFAFVFSCRHGPQNSRRHHARRRASRRPSPCLRNVRRTA